MHRLLGAFAISVVAVTTVLVCIPLYVLGVVRLLIPVSRLRRWLAYPMDTVIDVWVSVFRWLIRTFRLIDIQVDMPRDLRDRHRWQVIVCNHQSWVDIVILQTSFRDVAPVLKFFTKRELIWVPFIGIAMWFLGFPYVYRAKPGSKEVTDAKREVNEAVMTREGIRFLDKPVSVINFVEGTRFTPAKRDARNSPYEYLLSPRRGGVLRTMTVLDDRVQTVLNATIDYGDQVPGFWDMLSGKARTASLTVKEIPKPSTELEPLSDWLNEIWAEKDQVLSRSK